MTDGADKNEDPSGSGPLTTPTDELFRDTSIQGCSTMEFAGESRPVLGGVVLLSRLGRGGMASVYFGRHPRLDVDVAVKVIARGLLRAQPQSVRRFVQEAQIAAGLNSAHLVHVFDVDRDPESDIHYIVMEFVNGPNASEWARSFRPAKVPEEAALELCLAATKGLAVAHERGIIHRDIKPGNILIQRDADGAPDPTQAKLADLGLAKFERSRDGVTLTGVGVGTPGFMAPEQYEDIATAHKPADVFAVGATLYSLLAGSSPFATRQSTRSVLAATLVGDYTPLAEVRDDLSEPTMELVARCLRTEPERRFEDALALREALRRCLDERRATESTPRKAPGRRKRLVPVALLLLAATAFGIWWSSEAAPFHEDTVVAAPVAEAPPEIEEEPELEAPLLETDERESFELLPAPLPPAFAAHEQAEPPFVSATLRVAGRLTGFDPERHVLSAAGRPLEVNAAGVFDHELDTAGLAEGEGRVRLEVLARDTGEVLAWQAYGAVVDRTPPTLEFEAPFGGPGPHVCNASTVRLRGTVRDAHAPRLLVDGEPIELSRDGAFTRSLHLEPGPNAVALRALDAAGNEQSMSVVLVLDHDPPVFSEVRAASSWSGWRVQGRTTDEHLAEVLADGQPIEMREGVFDVSVESERSSVLLVASDRAGNRSERRVARPLQPAKPAERPIVVEIDPALPTALEPEVVVRGFTGGETARVEVSEWSEAGKPTGWSEVVTPVRREVPAGGLPASFAVSVPGGLTPGTARRFLVTPFDGQGRPGKAKRVEMAGALEVGRVVGLLQEEWVGVSSTRALLTEVEERGVTLLVCEDGSLLRKRRVRNRRGDRGITAEPADGTLLSAFERKAGQRVYALIPMRIEASGR